MHGLRDHGHDRSPVRPPPRLRQNRHHLPHGSRCLRWPAHGGGALSFRPMSSSNPSVPPNWPIAVSTCTRGMSCRVARATCRVRRTARRHAERRGEVLPPAPAQPAAPSPVGDPLSWFQEQRNSLTRHEYGGAEVGPLPFQGMRICPRCGDKRCPRAWGLTRDCANIPSAETSPVADVVSLAEYRGRP